MAGRLQGQHKMHRLGLFVRIAVGSKGTVRQERLNHKNQKVAILRIDWVNDLSGGSSVEIEIRPL